MYYAAFQYIRLLLVRHMYVITLSAYAKIITKEADTRFSIALYAHFFGQVVDYLAADFFSHFDMIGARISPET